MIEGAYNGGDTLTGGVGTDRFEVPLAAWAASVVTDFTVGDGVDILSFFRADDLLQGHFSRWSNLPGSGSVAELFEAGRLRLRQDGADTVLEGDWDGAGGAGFTPFLRLTGVQASQITAFNLDGIDRSGAGSDRFQLGGDGGAVEITDFAAGGGDDVLDLRTLVLFLDGFPPTINPFASGHL